MVITTKIIINIVILRVIIVITTKETDQTSNTLQDPIRDIIPQFGEILRKDLNHLSVSSRTLLL